MSAPHLSARHRTAVGTAAPVVLVLGGNAGAPDNTYVSLENAGFHVMPCCEPMIALGWLVEHEGFFDCVVVQPDLADAHGIVRFLVGARAAELEVSVLVRTAFPIAEGGLCDIRISDIYPHARRIPVGPAALHASLRNHCSGLGGDVRGDPHAGPEVGSRIPGSPTDAGGHEFVSGRYPQGHDGPALGASRFLVLHLFLVSLGTALGGALSAVWTLISGEHFWDGVILYIIGAGLGLLVSIVSVRLGAWGNFGRGERGR